jgi:hypothetical protein
MVHRAQAASIRNRVQAQNFTRLAFGDDLEWPAAHFAIRREPLKRHTRVDPHLEHLAAVRALDVFRDFHPAI